jgi:hypothetical protein
MSQSPKQPPDASVCSRCHRARIDLARRQCAARRGSGGGMALYDARARRRRFHDVRWRACSPIRVRRFTPLRRPISCAIRRRKDLAQFDLRAFIGGTRESNRRPGCALMAQTMDSTSARCGPHCRPADRGCALDGCASSTTSCRGPIREVYYWFATPYSGLLESKRSDLMRTCR